MAIIPALILAAVDYFVTRRDPKQVAQDFKVEENDLAAAYHRTRVHSWAAKLAAALEDPDHRPDLIVLKRHLACFEQQFEDLMVQYQYARQTCDHVRSFKLVDSVLVLKADTLAFRIHQAANRILRDIVKAEIRLEKAEKTPPSAEAAPQSEPSGRSNVTQAPTDHPTGPNSTSQISTSVKQKSQQIANQAAVGSAPRTETSPPQTAFSTESTLPPQQATDHQPPAPTFPTPEEFKLLIFKHRHRIKDTPAKNRPELIARLIEQDRMRKREQPDPHQNGKQAA